MVVVAPRRHFMYFTPHQFHQGLQTSRAAGSLMLWPCPSPGLLVAQTSGPAEHLGAPCRSAHPASFRGVPSHEEKVKKGTQLSFILMWSQDEAKVLGSAPLGYTSHCITTQYFSPTLSPAMCLYGKRHERLQSRY